VGRFVFTSILSADQAKRVPHFYQKAVIEAELERSGLPLVALRPGGFIDTLLGMNAKSIAKGKPLFGVMGLFSSFMGDNGNYAANTTWQREVFGYSPSLDESIKAWASNEPGLSMLSRGYDASAHAVRD